MKERENKMTRCGMCGKSTQAGEKPINIVIQTRSATYAGQWNGDRTTHGREIVREIKAHQSCVDVEVKSVS